MLTALQVELKFDPHVVSSEVLKKVAAKLFDLLFGEA
jgi:hypothetical protein